MSTISEFQTPPGAQIGKPVSRVDGRAKVTGAAQYAAEFGAPGLLHGFVVGSTIARGKIVNIEVTEALQLNGVAHVFTHTNRPNLPLFERAPEEETAPDGRSFRPLYNDEVVYSGQPIALVLAETLELARYAASLIRVDYEKRPHETRLREQRKTAYTPKEAKCECGFVVLPPPRGDADRALAEAEFKIDAEYKTPVEHHNPIETHASTVICEDDGTFTVYDKTQGVVNSQRYLSSAFNLSKAQVRVLSPFVGGAFGSGLRPQYQLTLAMMAAQQLRRSVRIALTRQQMFTFSHRPETLQRVALGAAPDGTLKALIHETIAETSQFEEYVENVVVWSALLYHSENTRLDYKVAKLDVYTPNDMRAPGAAEGVFALECAMDELAYKVGIDPLELRLKNYTERDEIDDKPYSSKELRACYAQAAERFGWSKRNPVPRSMREGKKLVGWGMASGVWEAMFRQAHARATLSIDGSLTVASATSDIGTGTYTIMTQIAADTLGLPLEDVTFKLGDSSLPNAPIEGGSWIAASVGSAVKAACEQVGERLLTYAQKIQDSPLANAKLSDVELRNGRIYLKSNPSRNVWIIDVMRNANVLSIEHEAKGISDPNAESQYSHYSHSAVFAEVKVDEDYGKVLVSRVVSAIAAGRILNPKTAGSQILGGIVWGIGMALEEETMMDHNLGRFMNRDLAGYHVPAHADVRDIEVIFVDEYDPEINPLGAKGVGEIGLVGVAAAIANAVFHATGKRIRDLPLTPDKLL